MANKPTTEELIDEFSIELADVINIPVLQKLIDHHQKLTGTAVAILDIKGRILVSAGFQDICSKFHRVHPESQKHCLESDTCLSSGVLPGNFKMYRCKNSMRDVATPIMIGDKHLGNIFIGQFFYDDDEIDYAAFKSQAKCFGYDEVEYMRALDRVPRYSREYIDNCMHFLTNLAQLVSRSNFDNFLLKKEVIEREKVEQKLRHNEEELRGALAVRDEFISIASHELRTPLTSLRLQLGILARTVQKSASAIGPKILDLNSRAMRAETHLSRLVDELLDITYIRVGKIKVEKMEMELTSRVAEVIKRMTEGTERSSQSIVYHAPEKIMGLWDIIRIDQIVTNIISNAIKYGEGKPILISAFTDPVSNVAKITVRDHGKGISSELQTKIFERFERGDMSRDISGLGLGLYIVKQLVSAHDGNITVKSALGEGATFTIELPLR